MAPLALWILEGDDCVVCEDYVEDQSEVEEPTVAILENQRGARLAGVLLMWLGDCACRWRHPEGTVISLAVVITSKSKTKRED